MRKPHVWFLACAMAAMTLSGWSLQRANTRERQEPVSLVLLLPDASALKHPVTQAWLDAAQEEGIALLPWSDDTFVQALSNQRSIPGVILPDTVHPQASDVLVNALYQYAAQGGHVLVGFDAALLDPLQRTYAAPSSRLSGLTGVTYARYEALRENTTHHGPVYASAEGARILAIQPGKLDFDNTQPGHWGELTTYGYKTLAYNHFQSTATPDTQTLMQSGRGDPIVSTHAHGKGSVLFANLPLGYLKTRTDSYLLHRILSHFAIDMARQPVLSGTPGGIGGMVLNLHVDSNAAQAHLKTLEEAGWFDDGPYTIHVTAGPDTYTAGDRMGTGLEHNPWMQAFLKRQHDKGHDIGNHGGWIHNVFGDQANEHNRSRFEPYLDKNHQAISLAVGQRPLSYSAPMGNQPVWVTNWLERHDFKAYYSTSDTGLGPTRAYIQGHRAPEKGLWTFPISNFKRIATMDELHAHKLQEADISLFIQDLLEHVSQRGIARLFYFHPPVSREYHQAMETLRSTAHRLQAQGQFRWYSMVELADFQNKRMAVQWHVTHLTNHKKRLTATSATTLANMTWLIPKFNAQAPHLVDGSAQIVERHGQWQVVANNIKVLEIEWSESP